jgi:hypothetical protein
MPVATKGRTANQEISVNISKIMLALACLAGITQSARSQNAENAATHGILGYLDARTGAFKPIVQPTTVEDEQAAAAAAISPTTGKFVFNFTINVVSSLPTNEVIVCSATANVFDITSVTTITEEASVLASRSGSKATCTVTIPYSWPLSTASQDKVGLGFSVAASSTTGVLGRLSNHSLPSIKVPSSGATTTQTLNATI